MSNAFNNPRHRRKPAINITSLIDVMFLLLIFFMVSSTFKQYMGIDVTLPQAANATSQESTDTEIRVGAEGDYMLAGESVTAAGLEAGMRALVEQDAAATFILRADTDASFGAVLRAIDIAKTVGGDRLIIPTDPLRDEPEG